MGVCRLSELDSSIAFAPHCNSCFICDERKSAVCNPFVFAPRPFHHHLHQHHVSERLPLLVPVSSGVSLFPRPSRPRPEQLRGAATLAHHPKYLRHTANLPRVTRGVRLVAPEATHSMQEALARSLGHSTGSRLLFLDSKAIEAVSPESWLARKSSARSESVKLSVFYCIATSVARPYAFCFGWWVRDMEKQ